MSATTAAGLAGNPPALLSRRGETGHRRLLLTAAALVSFGRFIGGAVAGLGLGLQGGCSALMPAGRAPASEPTSSALEPASFALEPPPPAALAQALRGHSTARPTVIALGEIHDNSLQHAWRLGWLNRLLAQGNRYCVAMEQLDAARQPQIDAQIEAMRSGLARRDARALAQAGGFQFQGWEWEHYRPVIEFALRQGLPLIGANLSNADTASIARGQPHPMSGVQPADWVEADEQAMRQEIADGHCGVLPTRLLPAMATAQRARDATMARAVREALTRHGLPVLLLAGNGHVRRDLGVPRHLHGPGHAGALISVGFVEHTPAPPAPSSVVSDPGGLYDWRVLTAAQPRADPCAGLRERMSSGRRALLDRASPIGE